MPVASNPLDYFSDISLTILSSFQKIFEGILLIKIQSTIPLEIFYEFIINFKVSKLFFKAP